MNEFVISPGLMLFVFMGVLVGWFIITDTSTVDPKLRHVYYCTLREKYFIREVRSGYRNIAQDWWLEVLPLPNGKYQKIGKWFKHNIGYFPRKPSDTWPFRLLTDVDFDSSMRGKIS